MRKKKRGTRADGEIEKEAGEDQQSKTVERQKREKEKDEEKRM